jgi:hypothetical protein
MGNFAPNRTTTTSSAQVGNSDPGNLNPAHMTRDVGAGAAFLSQHQNAEAAKYKPGYKGSLN